MELTIIDLNITKTLLNPINVFGESFSAVTINTLILRPYLKRIVFTTSELDNIIVYDGEELFELHKDDSNDTLINILLEKIDNKYNI